MDTQKIIQIAGFIETTAGSVDSLTRVQMYLRITRLHQILAQLVNAGFETVDKSTATLIQKLEKTARRCAQCLFDRLGMRN